ncbi:MAG: beta-glucuronidase [Bacteroidaceae bacterium]|nr:beta-glucuronidase [Bacteroidaceae bacterium]
MKHSFKQMALAAMMTLAGFAQRAVAADVPRPEYPRPQFERAEWLNLNGTWTYAFDFGRSGDNRGLKDSKGFEGRITVPFCPESKLSGVAHTDFIPGIWYQREITVPEAWKGQRILLHFGAVDYEATIYIDGRRVMRHCGTGSSFEADITEFVTPGKAASLVVKVVDDLRGGKQPGGKQSTRFESHGCVYTRTTGIWQTVWMEPVNPEGLKQMVIIPDVDQQQLVVRPQFRSIGQGNTLTVEMLDGGKRVATRTVPTADESTIILPVKKPHLWSPEDPHLYDLRFTVKNAAGEVIDEVSSYAGMRKVHLAGGYFYLNNKPYFQRLVLDQGFYPDGIWTAPTDEALKQDIVLSKAVGFNGARLHQKVFEERYYYWADRLGYLTWGEEASWGLDVNDELAVRNFLSEWTEVVTRDRNHPSLVVWTPFNETWDARDGVYVRLMQDVYTLTKAIDPTRPVNDSSGDCHIMTDLWTVHDYTREPEKLIANHTIKPGVEPYRNKPKLDFLAKFAGQPYMLDEFGGLPWIKESERETSWGYGSNIDTLEDFYRILEGEIDAIRQCPFITGICYTQITDVEQEKNGIYYYDRTPKFDAARLKAIFEKIPSIIENPQDLSGWKAQ